MARILPDPLVGSFSSEVLRTHRALKAIPGDEFVIWVSLPLPGSRARPDFLVVHDGTTAFVIAVASTSGTEIEETLHGSLFAPKANPADSVTTLSESLRQRLRVFIETALQPNHQIGTKGAGPPAVYGLILFPNASHEQLRQLWEENPWDGCYWLGEEYISSDKLAACLRKLATGGLKERQLAQLRSHFSPETVVPPRFTARARMPRNVDAAHTPFLLDYDQEAWAKNRLRLSNEAAAVLEEPTPYGEATLVTGVAGSGKSLVLLFRACTQAQLDPQSEALVLTHNRALRRELELRFGELGRPPNVEWHTFFSWAQTGLYNLEGPREIVAYRDRDEIIAMAVRKNGGTVTSQWVDFVRDEIDWMQDRAITSREDYLAAERTGRGVRLTKEQRETIHAVYVHYSAILSTRQTEDWSGRALRLWNALEQGRSLPKLYDYIYIDEAQFFAPVWLWALRRALKPGTGRLLLAADPTQGFLKRRQSWVACGLDIRGRSTRLRRSYRNTRPILALAAEFYRARLGDEEETDLNLPAAAELASADPGEEPRVIPLTSRQDEVSRVINELKRYLTEGGDPDAVLVLVTSGLRTGPVFEELTRALGAHRVVDARKSSQPKSVRVCSIDGATGLEAPIVFLIGGAELLERESDLQMSAEQQAELRRDNTRRLYMGFTRAGMRLLITWVGPVPDVLRRHIG